MIIEMASQECKQGSKKHVGAIDDRFNRFSEISKDLKKAGLESSNLIIGIDYTKSNIDNENTSFNGRSLHEINGPCLNPYQRVIRSLCMTLSKFQEDPTIPVFGFGDIRTKDKDVFPLLLEGRECESLEEIFQAYNTVTPTIKMSGPTSFAPLIRKAIQIVKEKQQYHILVIITDGAVTSPTATANAIVEASKWPLSIIAIGVGDGPWDEMNAYDDELPERSFDNFQFVDYNEVLNNASEYSEETSDAEFAKHALMEIPDQFRAIKKLGYLDWK